MLYHRASIYAFTPLFGSRLLMKITRSSNYIASIERQLQEYRTLVHSSAEQNCSNLSRWQHWQFDRLATTHQLTEGSADYLACRFVFDEIYSGSGLSPMLGEIDRLLRVAAKLFPHQLMAFVDQALALTLLSARLDHTLVGIHFDELGYQQITPTSYQHAFFLSQQLEARLLQVEQTQALTAEIDKLLNSHLINGLFKVSRKPAYAAKLRALYDFIDRGLKVMRPIKPAAGLIDRMALVERDYWSRINQLPSSSEIDPEPVTRLAGA